MSRSLARLTVLLAGSLGAVACNNSKKPSHEVAQETFSARCAPCHGQSGKGDGPGAAALTPKPRDYTDATWQKSVTDDQLRQAIVKGGAGVGKSPMMPAAPDLESQPAVVDGLVKIIRGFGGK